MSKRFKFGVGQWVTDNGYHNGGEILSRELTESADGSYVKTYVVNGGVNLYWQYEENLMTKEQCLGEMNIVEWA